MQLDWFAKSQPQGGDSSLYYNEDIMNIHQNVVHIACEQTGIILGFVSLCLCTAIMKLLKEKNNYKCL